MLDIGRHIDSIHSDDTEETILGVIKSVNRNKLRILPGDGDGLVNISVANDHERLEVTPYKAWRVVALGMMWISATTVNEDPIIDFGYSGDDDAFAKMTSAITGGEKFCIFDHQKYDPLNLLTPEKITETSATLATTWTEGAEFGVWKNTVVDLWCREAAVGAMSTGLIKPYMLIEIDTGGKW
jgi:hypothetical protein